MKFIPFLLILLIFGACSGGKRTVTLNTTRPAELTVPAPIQTLLIVDRTRLDKNGINIIEGILTGELPEEDKAAVQAMTNALRDQLRYSQRYTTLVAQERLFGNSLTTAFPDAIDWRKIESLCAKYQADAVVAVELFDTDFILTEGKRTTEREIKTDSTTQKVEVDEFYANGVSNITLGLRFYNPLAKTIDDEQFFRRTNTWETVSESKADALAKLITKSNASRLLSEEIGRDYAFRIAPMPISIDRSFTGKTKKLPQLEQGSRYSDVGDWNKAISIWKEALGKASSKEDGLLSYNIAVGYEVLGDLDRAKEWAQRSYAQYGNKDGVSYVGIIDNRIRDEAIASQQLGN